MARGTRPGWMWRLFRHGDEASGTMASFVVGAAVFLISTTVLLNFVVEQPGGTTSGLQEATLKNKGFEALDVMLGTAGYPAAWDQQAETIDSVKRLGILEAGSTLRIDPEKFDAMAKGSYLNPSTVNGYVDYEEAKRALGLSGYDFHIRAQPVFNGFGDSSTFGVEGLDTFRVGYVGNWNGAVETEESKSERYALARFVPNMLYSNVTRVAVAGVGDAFKDDKQYLKDVLMPLLGTNPAQTIINSGTGSAQFYRMDKSTYESNFNVLVQPTLSKALGLGTSNTSMGYGKSREIRAVLGTSNMSGLASAQLTWKEWVDTGAGDAGDYGWIEASADNGVTWYPLTNDAAQRSQDHAGAPQTPPDNWAVRTVTLSSTNCTPCVGANEVLIAMHWLADSDSTTGKGWLVDDMQLVPSSSTGFLKTFERPEYDLLVFGSNIDQNELTPAEIKQGIRDFVNIYGGRIIVLGGESNNNWLMPIFKVGIAGTSPGVSVPDTSHPLLTVPNELDWAGYDYANNAWEFNTQADADLFNMVVGSSSTDHILTSSKTGAFSANQQDGVIMLTTYLPYTMADPQAQMFLANMLMYGRYHYLYMDFGPNVPTDVPVSSVIRTALMNKLKSGEPSYVEMGITLYVWEGGAAKDATVSSAAPSAPRSPGAVAGSGSVTLNWTTPASQGSGAVTGYEIYRSTSAALETHYRTICNCTTWVDTNVTNGQTYYYNVTAKNAYGQGFTSSEVSATPSAPASAPVGFSATGIGQAAYLSWSPPASNGGSSIVGYSIYRNASGGGAMQPYTWIGNDLSYTDVSVEPTVAYRYQVGANNSVGVGTLTAETTATPTDAPSAPILVATGGYRAIQLSWTVGDPGGSALTEYRIYAGSTSSNPTYWTTVAHPTTTYTHTPKNDSETWYYRVSAVNALQGEGPQSAVGQATTTTLPTVPLNFAVTNSSAGPGNLTLSWTAPIGGGVTDYKIYGGDTSGSLALLTTVTGATTWWSDTSLGNNRTRYYQVSAVVNALEGTKTSELSAKTYTVPYPPQILTAAAGVGASGRILLAYTDSYTDGTALVYYKIYRTEHSDVAATGPLSWHAGEYLQPSAVYVTGLNLGQEYDIYLVPVTAAGEGNPSNTMQNVAASLL